VANDRWEHPKRDLLDIERTAQAESVSAADDVACFAEALAVACEGNDNVNVQHFAALTRRAVNAYRASRGLDVEPDRHWTAQEIIDHAG